MFQPTDSAEFPVDRQHHPPDVQIKESSTVDSYALPSSHPCLDSSALGYNHSPHCSRGIRKGTGNQIESEERTAQLFFLFLPHPVLSYRRKVHQMPTSPPFPVPSHLLTRFLPWANSSLLKDSVQMTSPSKEPPLSPSPGLSAVKIISATSDRQHLRNGPHLTLSKFSGVTTLDYVHIRSTNAILGSIGFHHWCILRQRSN